MTSEVEPRRDFGALLVFGLYLAFAIALTFPLILRLPTAVANDLGDPLLNMWILWWNATHVPLTSGWWNAPAFFPAENVLAFSEHLAGLSPISSPVYWLTGSAVVSYNVVFLLTFALSAFAGYLLCLHLTGRRDAAFLGGLAFGFAPYRVAQFPHLQVLATFWMPVGLLGLHRFVDGGGWKWLALFAAMWLMQALTNGYYLAFFSILVAIWIAWFVPWRRWRTAVAIGAAWGVAFAAMLPVLIRYRHVHEAFGFRRRFDEILGFSADVASIFDASAQLAVWGFMHSMRKAEDELFPGLTVIVLIVLGVLRPRVSFFKVRKTKPEVLRSLLLLATLVLLAAGITAFVSPGETTILGLRLSANHPEKPLTLALGLFVLFLATSRTMADAYRRRSPFVFYLLAAAVMWLLCLGPVPTLLGRPILETAPYAWLLNIPGWDALRVPARFTMLMILCLSTAAALAYRRIWTSTAPRARFVMTSLFACAILADGWVSSMPLEPAPAPWPRGTTRTAGPLLSLPLGDPGDDLTAMYRGMWHGKPIANGYSGNFPAWYWSLRLGIEARDPSVLDELAALGVNEIVLDTSLDPDGSLDKYALTRATRLDSTGGQYAVYRLSSSHKPAAGPGLTLGAPLPIRTIEVNVNSAQIRGLTDGDLQTRWETGPQTGKEELIMDLGEARPIAAVVLELGPFGSDFPRELQVDLSDDGQNWTGTWRGSGTGAAFVAAIRDPRRVPLIIALESRRARYIRLRQLAQEPTYYWSIAELSVH
ncbi:MAG TPA: discoidin domain-containing protein [Vicinamibacterales bacterium]|nr:discoidin domain-containing protein [Vicinamibacterales bacterium]